MIALLAMSGPGGNWPPTQERYRRALYRIYLGGSRGGTGGGGSGWLGSSAFS